MSRHGGGAARCPWSGTETFALMDETVWPLPSANKVQCCAEGLIAFNYRTNKNYVLEQLRPRRQIGFRTTATQMSQKETN